MNTMKAAIRQFFSLIVRTSGYLSFMGLGMILGVVFVAYFMAGEIYDYQDTVERPELPQVDAIVCLGGGRGRITAAGDLWNAYFEKASMGVQGMRPHPAPKTPVLYFSGMGKQSSWGLLSKQIRKDVLNRIRESDVIIEKESLNTAANARWLAKYAQERHWKKILLMTSSYHMKRANFIFDRILKSSENPIEVETLSVYQDPFDSKNWKTEINGVRVTLLEYLKWVYYHVSLSTL